MASKLKLISDLYNETIDIVTSDSEKWQSFLKCASNNYKYNFSEQLLIYAQKSNAVACADIDTWNKVLKRWVNKGASGIALLNDDNGYLKLRYVFDVSDTHSKYGKNVSLWKVDRKYDNEIIESLENKYGELSKKETLQEALISTAVNLTDDNYTDYFNELIDNKIGTKLEYIEDNLLDETYKDLLSNSIAFVLLNRCGIDPMPYFSSDDFININDFNHIETITRLGSAVSDISEMGLREIYNTLKNIKINEIDKIRTFDTNKDMVYDESAKEGNAERRDDYEHSIQENRELRTSESWSKGESEYESREVFNDEIRLSEKSQQESVSDTHDARFTYRPSNGDRKYSTSENINDNRTDEETREDRRELEENGTDKMGSSDEQHQKHSGGDSNQRTNLQLETYESTNKISKYIVLDEKINQILSQTPHLHKSNEEIKSFFKNEKNKSKRIKFLKEVFDDAYTGIIIDDQMFGYKAYDNGIFFWKGNYLTREAESFVSWYDILYHYDAMILLKQLDNVNEMGDKLQLSLFDSNNVVNSDIKSDIQFTQDFIDRYLVSRHKETKFGIYEHFKENELINHNVLYLKEFYGIGGESSVLKGSGIGVSYDTKGIEFSRGHNDPSTKKELFSWNYVAKRIKTLIEENRYLDLEELKEYREQKKQIENEYDYKIGDKVFIDAKEFQIEEISDFDIKLHDLSFPLISRTMNIVEFETKLSGNPNNDKLKNNYDEVEYELEIVTNMKDLDDEKSFTVARAIDGKNCVELHYTDGKPYIEITEKVRDDSWEGIVDDANWFNRKLTEKEVLEKLEELFVYNFLGGEIVSKTIEPTIENVEQVGVQKKLDNYVLHPEVSYEERMNYVIKSDDLGFGSLKDKFRNNIEAIKVLKLCELQNRYATKEEQEVLSKYVGWGGLSQGFDETNDAWRREYNELKELLTNEEYETAKDSVLTAFYTPPVVIRSMYKALSNMGFDSGNILEPSCGIGNFIGLLPDNDKVKIYGVEIDDISGRIARQLYQRASIAIKGFEETNYSNSFFDVAIGNVPFGDYAVYDKMYDKYHFMIHDYFFAKAIDKVRPGGIVAFITSKGTMDKNSDSVRKYLSQRADLLGAIRLPNNTFKENAGTTVTSDILFFQKRTSITNIEPNWVSTGINEDGIEINNYFIEHPEMILGNMKMISGRFGPESACIPYDDENLEDLLESAISNIHVEIKNYELEELAEEDISLEADLSVKNFSYTIVDNKIYYRENSKMYLKKLSLTTENRIKGLIELRDCVRQLINMQLENFSEEKIKYQQDKLNNLYDIFTKKYGLINSRANATAFSDDSSYYLLCSLEILNDDKELERKADIFYKRTISPGHEIKTVDTASDALILSLSEKACVDLDYMSRMSNISIEKLISDLEGSIFKIPNIDRDIWVSADEYLSGNVREKLKIAEEFAKQDSSYNVNVNALRNALPQDIPASEITVRFGATWIPSKYYEEFLFEILESSYYARQGVKIYYSDLNGEWYIKGKQHDRNSVRVTTTYGTSRANAYKIYEDGLNLRDTRIFDYSIDSEGKKVATLNKKETAIAQSKHDKIETEFEEWIWKDPDRREELTKIYNEIFNSIRLRKYDGSLLRFVGMNPEIKLREHQLEAAARGVFGGNSLYAHEVGAGKTFTMVATAMECKRLGLCNKSLFVVPNHIIEQFASEFLQLYPSANILVSTKKDFETANRKKFCSRIATGEYDAIIIGHSQFEKIPMSAKRQEQMLKKQLKEILDSIEELKKNGGERFSVKQLVKTKKLIEKKLEKLNNQDKKDDVVTFEELGVDKLFVDEAHYYKNLFLYTKMRNVSGIAQTEAQKSSDLQMKCRYLDEITNNKGVIFATGTPISNSMVELYTMQRYLQYDTLVKHKLQHFDAWASTFGRTKTVAELAPEGTGYRCKTRFASFYNLPELMNIFKEVADIRTADMLNLPVPKANYETIVVKPSEIQLEFVKSFSERAEKVRKNEVSITEDNMLKITNDGRKLALDQRLMDDLLPDEKDSKVDICSQNVYNIWQKNSENKLTQLVFCDLSTPKSDGTFNIYFDLKNKLTEKGIPEEEIEFIHNANTETRKQELFAKVRKGQIRVLIGSTPKMGAGTNCQDKLIALHDLDCPWRPSDLTQRSGRIVRQGNKNEEVFIYRYVTEKTFDAYLYQLIENKQKFISQIMTSKTPIRTAEDIDEVALSYAEIKALAAGNPLILEKTELDSQVTKLKLLKQSYLNEKYRLEDQIRKDYPEQIKNLEKIINDYKLDIEVLEKNTKINSDGFSPMIINDKSYSDRKEAGMILTEEILKCVSVKGKEIGEYRGFKMYVKYDTFFKQFKMCLINNMTHVVELGSSPSGNIIRIDNVLDGFNSKLTDKLEELENVKIQSAKAKEEAGKPFAYEQELKEKLKRLNELNRTLNLNEKNNDIIDENPDDLYVESQIYKSEYER